MADTKLLALSSVSLSYNKRHKISIVIGTVSNGVRTIFVNENSHYKAFPHSFMRTIESNGLIDQEFMTEKMVKSVSLVVLSTDSSFSRSDLQKLPMLF